MAANFRSRTGLLLALTCHAVGLGSFLHFSMPSAQHDAAFTLPFILCVWLIGIPLAWAAWETGKHGARFGRHSAPFLLELAGQSRYFRYAGSLSLLVNLVTGSYCCYLLSRVLAYSFFRLTRLFSGETPGSGWLTGYAWLNQPIPGETPELLLLYALSVTAVVFLLFGGLNNVEKVAKLALPLLLLCGLWMLVQDSDVPCADCQPLLPRRSPGDLTLWQSAAGQALLIMAIGTGMIQSFSAFLHTQRYGDTSPGKVAAAWFSRFLKVVPTTIIAVILLMLVFNSLYGYAADRETAVMLQLPGVALTSVLLMGAHWRSFMQDAFGWNRKQSAWLFGAGLLVVGLPAVALQRYGWFDEYLYWIVMVVLIKAALLENIVYLRFLNGQGNKTSVPAFLRALLRYGVPALLLVVLVGATVQPVAGWKNAIAKGWIFDENSIIGRLTHKDVKANRTYIADHFESEVTGVVERVDNRNPDNKLLVISRHEQFFKDPAGRIVPLRGQAVPRKKVIDSLVMVKAYVFGADAQVTALAGSMVRPGYPVAAGRFISPLLYTDMARVMLVVVLAMVVGMVYVSEKGKHK